MEPQFITTSDSAPLLGKPGAGLPRIERIIARIVFTLYRSTRSDSQATKDFELEAQRITSLFQSQSSEFLSKRILIDRTGTWEFTGDKLNA